MTDYVKQTIERKLSIGRKKGFAYPSTCPTCSFLPYCSSYDNPELHHEPVCKYAGMTEDEAHRCAVMMSHY